MINTIVDKVKGFLLNPRGTFQQSHNDVPAVVFTYFAPLLLLYAILSAIIAAIGMIGPMSMHARIPWGGCRYGQGNYQGAG